MNTDKIWANQYYSVTFFILDYKGAIITTGSFKTQTGMGLPASYFQIANYADIADMEEVNMIITSNGVLFGCDQRLPFQFCGVLD